MSRFADIITPNGFEAELLTGIKPNIDNINLVLDKLHLLGPRIVIITSVESNGYFLYGSYKEYRFRIPLKMVTKNDSESINFTGTGDVFSALLLAQLHLKDDLRSACVCVVDTIYAILKNTINIRVKGCELALVQSASLILNPPSVAVSRNF